MNATKVLWIFGFILASACILQANADPAPEPEPAKAHRSAYFNEPANPRFRSVPLPVDIDDEAIAELRQAADDSANANEDDSAAAAVPAKGDASSGRLFMKKFLLFKNIFGANSQQPVIPIIITGAGNTGATNPTTTITSTGTIPTATGTITTSPVTGSRQTEDNEGEEEPQAVDVQALQAALAANAAEYVVTDQEIKGTSDSKATNQPQSINLRPKGGKKGQFIKVRIPPQYRRYFKNGQKVMLNTNNRGGNRRVIKKRNNKNRRRVVNRNRNRLQPAA